MNTATTSPNCIGATALNLKGMSSVYTGKVRDVYVIDNKLIVMVVTDRVSAFDVVMPRPIPYKGQVLNQLAAYFLEATRDICPNWLISVPDPNASIGVLCKPYKIEMVIRGYLSGHAWRQYRSGNRMICGVEMPEGLRENDPFPEPIITPTTKSDKGHDEDISAAEIIARGIVPEPEYRQLEAYTRALYKRGSEMAADKGLILVDTKYEFGSSNNRIYVMDEIHTPDSSRYIYREGYEERQARGEAQKQLSKEFLRQWLIENGFQGLEGQQVPRFTDEFVDAVSCRYIELYECITGRAFVKAENSDPLKRIESHVNSALAPLIAGI